ncbi:39S ribosomal protein L35, mitochondrial [Protobothrops mucrosquamatus]|uniref:39S ribosomal protein L35, mitochondrial n=1 Tax=Protobothrops mucrosquamatus TaxID=103944 RepID=UPI000775A0C7|nr:39S ribosomal protein L35, mitochondrial [Protobothrops mucrosquamatus]
MAAFAAARRFSVLRSFCSLVPSVYSGSCTVTPIYRLSSFHISQRQTSTGYIKKPFLSLGSTSSELSFSIVNRVTPLLQNILHQQVRTVISYSLRKGKRKTVKPVVKRFLRLHCGLWLRRRAGYKKKVWKKKAGRMKRLREHVFCNKTQSNMLDKMTTSFWKRRTWYANDPYQKYHDRTNFPL